MSNNNFTKKYLYKILSKKTGYSVLYSKKLIDDFLLILSLNVKKSKFVLKNLGTFKTVYKNERLGRNPKTKESFIITARKSLSFKASKNLNKKINHQW